MKKLFKYFRSYIKETILAPLFKLLTTLKVIPHWKSKENIIQLIF